MATNSALPENMRGFQGGQETHTKGSGITSKIRNAKAPKVRPARGLRDTVLFPVTALPAYSGPYQVGTMEIEVPVREPRTFSDITRHGRHILNLETVLMTIYYPADSPPPDQKRSRELWIGRPRMSMTHGFGHFASLGWAVTPALLPTMFTKLPAWRNAPLSKKLPVHQEHDDDTQRKKKTDAKHDRVEDAKVPPTFPLIIFSHGLGGNRTMYSSICGELASHGFVVCAVEHRDGSGIRTFVNHVPGREHTENFPDIKEQHGPLRRKNGYDVVDYVFPKDNPMDTSPNNDQGVDRELRDAQIELRMAEIDEVYHILTLLHSGQGQKIYDANLRREGFKASSSSGLDGVDWSCWTDRFNISEVTALGHSFGAATVIEMLRHHDRFTCFTQGVILDIWSAGVRKLEDNVHKTRAPLLAVNSEAFTYWPQNFDFVQHLTSDANPSPSWLLTIRGTVHVSPSDFVILYPKLCSLLLKATANPRRALDLHVNAILEFLRMIAPHQTASINHAFPDEGLLTEDVNLLDAIPSKQLHRPKSEWTAARLRIRHEWMFRVSPRLYKKMAGRKIKEEGGHLGDEVWLHTKPADGEVDEYFAGLKLHRSDDGKTDGTRSRSESEEKDMEVEEDAVEGAENGKDADD